MLNLKAVVQKYEQPLFNAANLTSATKYTTFACGLSSGNYTVSGTTERGYLTSDGATSYMKPAEPTKARRRNYSSVKVIQDKGRTKNNKIDMQFI